MPYTHFQYIAYQVPTVGHTGAVAIYGIPSAAVPNPPPLQGNVAGLGADAQSRIQRFINVMIAAYNAVTLGGGDNGNTLKIFMAPEFYFRPNNANVAYTYAEYQAIKDVLRRTINADNRFRHWLVIPGTIMWQWTGNTPKRPTPPGQNVFFNSTIYIKGSSSNSQVIEKHTASEIDGIPTGRHGGGVIPNSNSTDEQFPRYQTQAKMRKHIFEFGGVKFGLDICLEHSVFSVYYLGNNQSYGVVKNSLSNWTVGTFNKHNKRIHLHLVSAGGIDIEPTSVAARTNGWILRNDGYDPALPVECKQVTAYNNGQAHDVRSTAVLAVDAATSYIADISGNANLSLAAPPGGAGYWATFPQKIKIYARQLI